MKSELHKANMKERTLVDVPSIEKIQQISMKKNGKRLTTKQAIAVQVYAKTGNKSEAGRQAYPNQAPDQARVQGQITISKPSVENVLLEIMESKGITDEYLMTNIKEGIDNADIDGKKLNYIETALKLRGHLKNVNINLSHTIKETKKAYEL